MAWQEFYAAVMGYVEENNLQSPFVPKEADDKHGNQVSFEDDVVKTAYRQAVLKTHPDKEPGNEDLFSDIAQAKAEGNLNKFIDCAKELDVSIEEISIYHVEALEKEVSRMRKDVLEMTSSPQLVWYHSEAKKKKLIVERICNALKKE